MFKLLPEIISIIERGIYLIHEVNLRNTQKLSIIIFFHCFQKDFGILEQVSTGEGKSLIVVAFSIISALIGKNVDIITSSKVLSKRDSESFFHIFSLFGLSVGHNCDEIKSNRTEAYRKNIVYGEISSFQRDMLLDDFYNENILKHRKIGIVIIDEVDSMLLDKGQNILYLSHKIPLLDTLEQVLVYIWNFINSKSDETEAEKRIYEIKALILDCIYGVLRKSDLKDILNFQQEEEIEGEEKEEDEEEVEVGDIEEEYEKNKEEEVTINEEMENEIKKENIINLLWDSLIKFNFINHEGKMQKEYIKEFINDDLKDNYKFPSEISLENQNKILNHFKDLIHKDNPIKIPVCLEKFLDLHLEKLILNAFKARMMKEGENYILDFDRSETSIDLNVNIVVMDNQTGAEQFNTQWNDGLHQFLQLKHGCKLAPYSLKAIFISNIKFFKRYSNKIYGLTGTLGSKRERNLLKKMYSIEFLTIPTHKTSQFQEEDSIQCKNIKEWEEKIFEKTIENINEKKRSVLIICETIKQVEILEKKFKIKEVQNVHIYKHSYNELDIINENKELSPGFIIIATNLAGRGTDIKVSENLEKNGGLFVCLSYLPDNIRIEEQAFGRTGRKGQKGSGIMIFMTVEEDGDNDNLLFKNEYLRGSPIFMIKNEREMKENERLTKIEQRFKNFIEIEEDFLEEFKQIFIRKLRSEVYEKELIDLFLSLFLNEWVFWLDSIEIKLELGKKQDILLEKDIYFKKLNKITDFADYFLNSNNTAQLLKLGLFYLKKKKYDYSSSFFKKIIKIDENFNEEALYYQVFILIKRKNLIDKEMKKIFFNLKKKLNTKIEIQTEMESIINIFGKSILSNSREAIKFYDEYEKQKRRVVNLYLIFINSIDDIIGNEFNSIHFKEETLEGVEIDEFKAEYIYNLLIDYEILKDHRLKLKEDNNFITEEIKLKYQSYYKEIQKSLLNLNRKKIYKRDLKGIIPCKEEFWKILIELKVVKNEEIFYIINLERFESFSLYQDKKEKIKSKYSDENFIENLQKNEKCIFLYPEFFNLEFFLNKKYRIIKKNELDELLSKQILRILKKFSIIYKNKSAIFNENKENNKKTLGKFDKIHENDFNEICGIHKNSLSKTLFQHLVKIKILIIENSSKKKKKQLFLKILSGKL